MNSLKQIRDQLVAVWNRSSKSTRAVYVAVTAVCLLLIVGVGVWSSRPQFVPLATNLSPAQAAQVVDLLDGERITNKLSFSGSTVLVPKKDFNRARLVVKDLPGLPSEQLDDEPAFPGFVPDPDRSLKRREQQIAKALMRMKAIKHASVTLALPDQTPFVREKQVPTAAVVVELHSNVPYSRSLGSSIASTVAGSVPGLVIENVSVFDTNNQRLSTGAESGGGIYDQLEHQRRVEADIMSKAHSMLAEVLGEGAAVISVTADINYRDTFRSYESYDADNSVKVKTQARTEKTNRSRPGSPRAAGTSSNVGRSAVAAAKIPVVQESEETVVDLLPSKTTEEIKEPPGAVKRLSVAATVDLSKVKDAGGQSYTKEQLEGLVKQAVGFDENRGDKITLVIGKIVGAAVPEVQIDEGIPWWQKYDRLVRSLSLGIAALVAFVIGLLVIRKLRPIATAGPDDKNSERRRSELVDELSSKVREHPEAVSRILAAWLNDPGRGGDEAGTISASRNETSVEQPRRRAA